MILGSTGHCITAWMIMSAWRVRCGSTVCHLLVVDAQLADLAVADRVAVDHLLDGELATMQGGPHSGWCVRREVAHLVQDVPGRGAGEAVSGLVAGVGDRADAPALVAVVQQRGRDEVRQGDALDGEQAARLGDRVTPMTPDHIGGVCRLGELFQQRVALGLDEELGIARQAVEAER